METKEFDYHLPEELIAQRPLGERDRSRLLCLDRRSGARSHRVFRELPRLLDRPSLLVVNDTRVFPARLLGHRTSGGRVELLLLRRLDGEGERWRCLGRPRRKLRPGVEVDFDGLRAVVVEADDEGLLVSFAADGGVEAALERRGHIPLPPYIRRPDDADDRERYQTIFAADRKGSVAAPTAGLHFTDEVVGQLEAQGHQVTSVTLHVGPGTFRPVRAERLEEHRMDGEWWEVSAEAAGAIADARTAGWPVIAVGTTVVRTLESAADDQGEVAPGQGVTELFITPGYAFKVIEGLLTNFHLPRSTLLALVSAFAGREATLAAYDSAVRRRYRFYSFGDAMLIR